MQKKRGFTLIEMVIVMFIISLLLLLIIPNLSQQKDRAEAKSDHAFIETLQTQLDLHKFEDSTRSSQDDLAYLKSQNPKIKEKIGKLEVTVVDGHVESKKVDHET